MSKRLFKAILDASPYAALVVDERLKVFTCNSSCKRIFSRSKEKIVGQKFSRLIPHKGLERRVRRILMDREPGTKLMEVNLDSEENSSSNENIPKSLRVTLTALKRQSFNPFCLITMEAVEEDEETGNSKKFH